MTTPIIYTTKVYTVTSCPPTVTSCPAKGHLTTETIVLWTTVCPVSAVSSAPATSSPVYSTGTLYTTKMYTITSYPPTVTSCPVGSTSTTVYPVIAVTYATSVTFAAAITSAVGIKTSVIGTGAAGSSKTTSTGSLQVTAAAGRISGRFEMAAAAAGVVAVAFL